MHILTQLLLLTLASYFYTVDADEGDRHPVLLFPGLAASTLEAKINKTTVPHFFCSKQRNWHKLWLDPAYIIPKVIDCFFDNMRLVYNETTGHTQNAEGVETRVVGFGETESIEFLTNSYHLAIQATGYYNALVEQLISLGYERGSSIRGAPYDFRKSPQELGDYFIKVKQLIEQMYEENEQRPVILVGHSMGGIVSYYFLLHQSQEWRDRYIKTWIPIATPFAGSVDSWKAIVTGDNLHIPIYNPIVWQPLYQTLSSMAFFQPDPERFHDTVIMSYNGKDYTSKDLPELFKILKNPIGYKMWLQTRNTFAGYPFPNVTTHCLRGTGVPTPQSLNFTDPSKFPSQAEIMMGPGDGTVNQLSSDVCLEWSKHENFYHEEFPGSSHKYIVRDKNIVAYITRQVLHANFYGLRR